MKDMRSRKKEIEKEHKIRSHRKDIPTKMETNVRM